jgi:hypothetical protein
MRSLTSRLILSTSSSETSSSTSTPCRERGSCAPLSFGAGPSAPVFLLGARPLGEHSPQQDHDAPSGARCELWRTPYT